MPSSISSSDRVEPQSRVRATRATWTFILLAVLLYACAELAATFGLEKISKLHRRIMVERSAALAIRHASPGAPPVMLVIGNSLLIEGLDFPRFTLDMAPRFRMQRFGVEATLYNDWYFALKALFRKGMRPDRIVLSLNPPHLAMDEIRGDFSARFLFDLRDIAAVAKASRADLTTTSSLYAAHFSTFYAARVPLRTVVMGRSAPPVLDMWQQSIYTRAVIPPDDQLIPVLAPRLKALDELCSQYGAKFAFLVPPTAQNGDTAVLKAGEIANVTVLRPVPNFSLPPEDYKPDGLHLNARGAAIFTDATERSLSQLP